MTVPVGWIIWIRLQQPLMAHHQYIAQVCTAAPAIDTAAAPVCGPVPTEADPLCRWKHGGRTPLTSNRSNVAITYTIEPTRDRYDALTLHATDEGD